MDIFTLAVVHYLHVALGVSWLGTMFFTRTVLFPQLRTLPKDTEQAVLRALQGGRARKITMVTSWGTVLLGILRGAMNGALGNLTSAYGLTYLASAVLGLAMVIWLWTPWFKSGFMRRAYELSFIVMFTLMVAMRFGY